MVPPLRLEKRFGGAELALGLLNKFEEVGVVELELLEKSFGGAAGLLFMPENRLGGAAGVAFVLPPPRLEKRFDDAAG